MVMPLPEEWGKKKIEWYYWCVAGLVFGIVSGLLGIGGGLMILPALVCVFGVPVHEAMATCSACIVFSSAGSTLSYIVNGLAAHDLPPYSLGYVNLIFWAAIVIPTIPFTIIGARLSDRLSPRKLSFIFACLIVVIACYMLGLIPLS